MTKIVCLIGKSGAGKTTISNLLEKQGLRAVKSHTTRAKRKNEIDDKYFVSKGEFAKLRGKMVAYTIFDDEEYGTVYSEVKRSHFYVIDPKGYDCLCRYLGKENVLAVYLDVSFEERLRRMIREREVEKVAKRLIKEEANFEGFVPDVILTNETKQYEKQNIELLKIIIKAFV